MSRIYKYPLGAGLNKLTLPVGSKLLSIKVQHDAPVAYFSVDDIMQHKADVAILLVITGNPIPEGEFIDTLLLDEGNFVLHAFLLE